MNMKLKCFFCENEPFMTSGEYSKLQIRSFLHMYSYKVVYSGGSNRICCNRCYREILDCLRENKTDIAKIHAIYSAFYNF